METPQSFTARRSAASNLPTFQLPPPDLSNLHNKFPTLSSINTSQPTSSNPGNILTPPVGVPGDGLSPLSSSVNSGSSQSSTAGVAPYNPLGGSFWQQPSSSYTFSAAPQMPSPFTATQNPMYMGRQLYSPSMNFPGRSGNSPTSSEALPPPPYDLNLPPFPTSMPMSGSGNGPSSLPTLAPQQQQQHQQHHQQHQHQQHQQHQQHHQQHQHQHQHMGGLMNSQSQSPSLQHSDSYGSRGSQSYSYAPSSTPQQSSFPAYALPSPTSQSSINGGPNDRISPVSSNQSSYSRPYGSYSLPAMAGPIMSNVHSPGSQMALVGGMSMNGYPSHMHHMYGGHPNQQQPQNDRPFKCDQCPQSFNRNHDLKRHKRIHLAVKPFPCGHCEKSFSRKDALKRHILVKGCGRTNSNGTVASGGSVSPIDKSEVLSDSADDNSPEMMKKEI